MPMGVNKLARCVEMGHGRKAFRKLTNPTSPLNEGGNELFSCLFQNPILPLRGRVYPSPDPLLWV